MSYPTVSLIEEVMREGMQIESVDIAVEDKIRLLDRLSGTGLKTIVVGSFVSPRYTPQMSRIEEVVAGFHPVPGVDYTSLALNPKGRERAAAFTPPLIPRRGVPTLVVHMCDVFVRRNTNSSQADEIGRWEHVVQGASAQSAKEAGIALGAPWGSNFSGPVAIDESMSMLRRQHKMWDDVRIPVTHIMLLDPMSWCMPHEVEGLLMAVIAEWPEISRFHLHLHNARGMALPSIYAALRVLNDRHALSLDTTAGGIGGCPYCGNGRATGMAATEDVVSMLEAMGIPTGIDLDELIDVVWDLERVIGRTTPGFVSQAGPRPGLDRLYDPNLPFIETHEEARHFKRGRSVTEHQLRPWTEPIQGPASSGAPTGPSNVGA
jgi:hydroxymethylglutaryl-CoA lyase